MSMYGGSTDVWGCQYGGVDNKTACKDLPEYPQEVSEGVGEGGREGHKR